MAEPGVGLPGIAGHFDVAEAVVGEARLVDLRALALERVGVGDLRAADVVEVERAVGLERLGVAQRDRRSRAGRDTLSRHQPTMFWPRSKMYTPGFGSVRAIGLSVSVTRIGSIIWAASMPPGAATICGGCHFASSKPGLRSSRAFPCRASYSSPSYSLLARIGPSVVSFQVSSLTTCRLEPSV